MIKLLPLLETALSTASVTVGDSIQFTNTVTNMSEAANILFVCYRKSNVTESAINT